MLEAIGLSPVESRVYIALIGNPRSSVAALASEADVSVRLASRTLGQLVQRGLANRLPGRQARFLAAAPDLSLQPLLSRREDELHEVRRTMHELLAAFHRSSRHVHPADLVEVITGAENIGNRAFALQDGAQALFRGIDKAPYIMSVEVNAEREFQRLREGIEYRILYDRAVIEQPGRLANIQESCARGEKARVVADPPLKLWMVDDSAALIPIRSASYAIDAAFVVHPSALLDALIALFELEWTRGVPMRSFLADRPGPITAGPDELTRKLLALLACGLTDESIARTLGLGLRTVQRRISALMSELNASTRFQAGMAARDRGWV